MLRPALFGVPLPTNVPPPFAALMAAVGGVGERRPLLPPPLPEEAAPTGEGERGEEKPPPGEARSVRPCAAKTISPPLASSEKVACTEGGSGGLNTQGRSMECG